MTLQSKFQTRFEDLSDEIIISILEYLSLEDLISIFGILNNRLSCIIFDHPWTRHRLCIHKIDDDELCKKIDFIKTMKLTPKISSIKIQPFSIYRSIDKFNQYNLLFDFTNLQALSFNYITLQEAESIFLTENFLKLIHLNRLVIQFSFVISSDDYYNRIEVVISNIFRHPTLQHCTIHTTQSLKFSQVQSQSSIEQLIIDHCDLQSLCNLLAFTPNLNSLTARITANSIITSETIPIPSSLNTLRLELSVPMVDELQMFLEKFSKLQLLSIETHSISESLDLSLSWFQLITEHLPLLIKFKRKSNVEVENVAEFLRCFHWPNRWQFKSERARPNGPNFSQIAIVNTRY